MYKIQRISDFQHELSFFNVQDNFDIYYQRFLSSDLGKIHTAIPFDTLIKSFKLKESHKGTKNLFSPKGKVALMFLKHYAACSDKKLIEQLNGNINYQFFCDIYIGTDSLLNYKIVSQIRCELSHSLQIRKQKKSYFLIGHLI